MTKRKRKKNHANRPSFRSLSCNYFSTWKTGCDDHVSKFHNHISALIQASFFQQRICAKIKSYLPQPEFERSIHTFITSLSDYCNSLYLGFDQSFSAATAEREKRCSPSIRPVLHTFLWLPILSFIICPPPRALRSDDKLLLAKTRLESRDDRALSVAAPRLQVQTENSSLFLTPVKKGGKEWVLNWFRFWEIAEVKYVLVFIYLFICYFTTNFIKCIFYFIF